MGATLQSTAILLAKNNTQIESAIHTKDSFLEHRLFLYGLPHLRTYNTHTPKTATASLLTQDSVLTFRLK